MRFRPGGRLRTGATVVSCLVALCAVVVAVLAPEVEAAQPVARDALNACFPAAAAAFSDRPDGEAGTAVDCVAHFGLAQGTSPDTYAPAATVTREQMASFLVRTMLVAGDDVPVDPTDHFTDDEGSVHELRINQLAELEITTGTGDGLYRPSGPVTRAQMASFVARQIEHTAGQPLPEPSQDWFADDTGSVHERRTNQLADLGV